MSLQKNQETITLNMEITPEERERYFKIILKQCPDIDEDTIELTLDGVTIRFKGKKRRRILAKMNGTFIGDPDTWNDAKRAEYYDTRPNPIE